MVGRVETPASTAPEAPTTSTTMPTDTPTPGRRGRPARPASESEDDSDAVEDLTGSSSVESLAESFVSAQPRVPGAWSSQQSVAGEMAPQTTATRPRKLRKTPSGSTVSSAGKKASRRDASRGSGSRSRSQDREADDPTKPRRPSRQSSARAIEEWENVGRHRAASGRGGIALGLKTDDILKIGTAQPMPFQGAASSLGPPDPLESGPASLTPASRNIPKSHRTGDSRQSSSWDNEVRPSSSRRHSLNRTAVAADDAERLRRSTSRRSTKDLEKEKDEAEVEVDPEDPTKDPDFAWMPQSWRENLVAQTYVKPRKPVTFTELFRFTTPLEHFLNAVGFICAIIAGAAQPGMTIFFGNLTTAFTEYGTAQLAIAKGTADPSVLEAAKNKLFHDVNKDALALVGVGIAMFVATFIYTAAWIYTGEATTRRIRETYLRAVLRQNVAYFDKLGAGEVTTRIQTDTHLIQDGISDKIPMSVSFIAMFFSGFIIAYIRNWRLSLILSCIIPVIAIAGGLMNRFMSAYRRDMLEQTAQGGTMAEEAISSVRNAHAFGTQKKLLDLYDRFNEAALRLGRKSALANGIGMMLFFFVIYGAYALAFWEGSRLLVQGHITSGGVINVFFAILIASFSLAQLAPNMQAVSFAQGAASKLFSTIDRTPPIDSASPNGIKPKYCDGVIELDGVHFVYPSRPKVHVLKGFSATFASGKTVALVGQSGSGKSTIIGLLERFYDPVQGSIYLDGRDIRTLNIKWLRTQIGLVSQEPTLFAATVFGNVAMGLIGTEHEFAKEDVKRKMVEEACIKANADAFIRTLQKGYDTHIGERGMLLSGGQKQRIAIARAIVSDPKILLLDEATSALDTASEGVVQDALDKASAGRTTITIAHRLSTIKNADQIIVMNSGKIIEVGTHRSLLAKPKGAYKALVEAQKLREETEEAADDETRVASEESSADDSRKHPTPLMRRLSTRQSLASQALRKSPGKKGPRVHDSLLYAFYRLGKLNQTSKWYYLLGLSASAVIGMVYPVFGIVFGDILSVFSETEREQILAGGRKYGLYLFIIALVATTSILVQSVCMGISAERLSFLMRQRTFGAILRQDIAFFDDEEHSSGKLTADISDWAQKVNGLAGITLGVLFQSIVLVIGGTVIAIITQWNIGLVGTSVTPILISAGILRLRVIVLKDAKTKKAHEASAQLACESAAAIRTVASLTREEDAWNIYRHSLDEPQRQSNRIAVWGNLLFSVAQGATFWAISLIFWYGSHRLVEDNLTTKEFFTCLICTIFASIQAGNVFNFVPDMSKAKSAAVDYLRLVDSRPSIDAEEPVGNPVRDVVGHVQLEDVHFRYPTRPTVRVLRGLNLQIRAGQFAAICGPSGCGKSTLISLVERFYDPLAGRVLVDGKDISEMNVVDYRRHVSLVSQEPTLYAGTIRFNILLGANRDEKKISQKEIEEACRNANIHDFIMTLPDGYDTEVGGKGTMLSGGQKQRVAIARALIRDPQILLLDEATSALDSESEKVVQRALDAAAKGRTTIAVAHRISSIQNADVIFVLKDGKVAEQGRHNELLARRGLYFELVAQQALEKA